MSDSFVTLVTAAPSQELTTLARLKDAIGMATNENDTKLTEAIRQASSHIAGYCGRVFGRSQWKEKFRQTNQRRDFLMLRHRPATILSLTEDGVALADTAFEIEAESGIVYRVDSSDLRQSWAARVIVAEYKAGWWLPSFTGDVEAGAPLLPPDIEKACQLLAKATWYTMPTNPGVRSEEIPDVYSVGYALPGAVGGTNVVAGMSEEVIGLLGPYRNFKV